MSYQILFFNSKVQASIEAWPVGINASFVRMTQQMEISGPNLGMPYTRPFGDGLFEIRAKGAEGIGRAFFFAVSLDAKWSSCTASLRRRKPHQPKNFIQHVND